jgi:hypothetical protein
MCVLAQEEPPPLPPPPPPEDDDYFQPPLPEGPPPCQDVEMDVEMQDAYPVTYASSALDPVSFRLKQAVLRGPSSLPHAPQHY